jgi:hypothetical protein
LLHGIAQNLWLADLFQAAASGLPAAIGGHMPALVVGPWLSVIVPPPLKGYKLRRARKRA